MNSTTNTQTIFVNLFSQIKEGKYSEFKRFTEELNKKENVKELLNGWQYSELLTKSKRSIAWELAALKDFLIHRKAKQTEKEIAKELKHLQTVEAAGEFTSITVSVEWKKNRTWGSNPNAEAMVEVEDQYKYFQSGSIGGCGYDKNSTAVANAVNQCNEFLKAMYIVKEKELAEVKNRDLFGYGSGYGVLPRLEGGVGVSCYPAIFEKIGFTFKNTASGKTFDVYTISKKG